MLILMIAEDLGVPFKAAMDVVTGNLLLPHKFHSFYCTF